MKIYRQITLAHTHRENVRSHLAMYPSAYVEPDINSKHDVFIRIRGEYLRDIEMNDKYVKRMLPAWAKPDFGPKNIGAKVAAFYAENDKVVTRLHHSGFVVGSEEFSDWQETQPDPFRSTRLYRQSLGELRA